MDPRFQPQNNSPYPQNPNPYAQPNPYQAPGTQNGPNKYPTLPPINNPQNPQPYPQYPHNNAGYVPPGQYGHTQVRVNEEEDRERLRLTEELVELNRDYAGCAVNCYKFWSYATVIWATLSTLPLFLEFTSHGDDIPNSQIVPPLLYGIWIIAQSIVAIMSISKKSVSLATLGCWMVTISLIVGLSIEGWTINYLLTYPKEYRARSWPYFFTTVFFILNSIDLVLHVIINMVGAFKLRRILIGRAKVQVKLIDNSSMA